MQKVQISIGPELRYRNVPYTLYTSKRMLWPPFKVVETITTETGSALMQPVFDVETGFVKMFSEYMRGLLKPGSMLHLPATEGAELRLPGFRKDLALFDIVIVFKGFSEMKIRSVYWLPMSGSAHYNVRFEQTR